MPKITVGGGATNGFEDAPEVEEAPEVQVEAPKRRGRPPKNPAPLAAGA